MCLELLWRRNNMVTAILFGVGAMALLTLLAIVANCGPESYHDMRGPG